MIISQHGELRTWLSLLPFTNRPSEAIEILQEFPEMHRGEGGLEAMLEALTHAPSDEAEAVLLRMAETNTRLYAKEAWRDAVCSRGTKSAALRFVELVAEGRLDCNQGRNQRDMPTRVARLMDEHAKVRARVYRILEDTPPPVGMRVLTDAIADNPDTDGLILLIRLEMRHNHTFASYRTVERVVTKHVASENWEGTYEIVRVPAAELRGILVRMTADGGPKDVAARYLKKIDRVRERLGAHESEPRHPDIASGKTWPIIDSTQTEKGNCGWAQRTATGQSHARTACTLRSRGSHSYGTGR